MYIFLLEPNIAQNFKVVYKVDSECGLFVARAALIGNKSNEHVAP